MLLKYLCLTYYGILLLTHVKISASTRNSAPEKTYVFAFSNDGFPSNFVTKDNQLDGQSVRLVRRICERAGKSCDTAVVPRRDCWDTSTKPALSKALDEDWFDACANLPPSSQRYLGYQYAPVSYFKTPYPSLIVRPGSTITLEDLHTCNTFRLAYLDNLGLTPDCLLTTSYWVNSCEFVRIPAEACLTTGTSKVVKAVLRGQADLGLVVTRYLDSKDVKVLAKIPCSGDLRMELNIMMRKDNCALYNWWSAALVDFICHDNSEYQRFCKELERDFRGTDPCCLKPGIDIDCNATDGRIADTHRYNRKITRIDPCRTTTASPTEMTRKPKDKKKKKKDKKAKSRGKSKKSRGKMEKSESEKTESKSKSSQIHTKNMTINMGNFRNLQPPRPSSFGSYDSPLAQYFKSFLDAKKKSLQKSDSSNDDD